MPIAPKRLGIPLALTLIAIGALVLTLANPGAAAAANENRANLVLLPSSAKRLGVKDIRVISTGTARGRGKEIRLPVTGGRVGTSNALLRHGGGIRLRVRSAGRKARSLHLGRLQLKIGKRAVLTARLPRTTANQPLFWLRYKPRARKLDASTKTAKLRTARLVPTAQAKRIFREKLGVKRVRSLPLARFQVSADLTAFDLPELKPPPLVPLPPGPEKLARPATAVAVSSAKVTWCARASWVRYIGNGIVSNGASHEPAFVVNNNETDLAKVCDRAKKNVKPTSGPTAYRYYFTFKEGWYDAASQTAALYFTGRVRFNYPVRGIDLDFNDLEVEINGAATRSIFRVEGRGGTRIEPQRVIFAENGSPVPSLTVQPSGALFSGEMPSYLSEPTAVGVFNGFYMPPDNHDFGWISVEFDAAG